MGERFPESARGVPIEVATNLKGASQATFRSLLLAMEPAAIARFKAVVESYDNLATLRTEDPRHHYLRLYFDDASAEDVLTLIDSLSEAFSIRLIG